MAGRQGCGLRYTPEVQGRTPVINAAREGLHAGAAQYERVNSTPRFASRSMFGVRQSGCPPRQLIQSFKSSTAMNNTFGFASAACRAEEFASNVNAKIAQKYRNREMNCIRKCLETGTVTHVDEMPAFYSEPSSGSPQPQRLKVATWGALPSLNCCLESSKENRVAGDDNSDCDCQPGWN